MCACWPCHCIIFVQVLAFACYLSLFSEISELLWISDMETFVIGVCES